MVERKNIGIYWGDDAFYVVESTGTVPTKFFKVLHKDENVEAKPEEAFVPEGLKLISKLQDAFHHQDVAITNVKLSVPAKEIIFRSFIIPWMQSSEIKGVVEFEASKYIPFSLDELSFAYHPMTIKANGVRQIRIIFTAIKKDIMENYAHILEQASLQISRIEPSPLSLIRSLNVKEYIPEDKAIALIEKGEVSGKIIIIDKGIPQFVREFQLRLPTASTTQPTDPNALMTRLINEIRVSLDYFNRQDSQIEIEEILLLTSENGTELSQRLSEDLKMKIMPIETQQIFQNITPQVPEYLYAFGIGLVDTVASAANIDLSEKKSKLTQPISPKLGNKINYKALVISGIVTLSILITTFIFSNQKVAKLKKQLKSINAELGSFKDASTKKLQNENNTLAAKLNTFKSIRTESKVANLLAIIPKQLPDGIWIDSLEISYLDQTIKTNVPKTKKTRKGKKKGKTSKTEAKKKFKPVKVKMLITLTGYAYLENIREQFGLINQLLRNFKTNETIKEQFTDINLETTKAQKLNNFNVTYFKISLK